MAEQDSENSWDPTIYDFDLRPSDYTEIDENGEQVARKARVAVIRTSDRLSFRRCRRRWGWSSHLRGNIGPKQASGPLWMGTGFHFALEDFHSTNLFGTPGAAFKAYTEASQRVSRNNGTKLPPDWKELTDLSIGMLDYYSEQWLRNRPRLETFVWNGIPQVEVNFRVELPIDVTRFGYDLAEYSGTLDRVVVDEHGQLWIVEYKTAKSIQTLHLDNDTQVSSYCWAGSFLYDRPITGVIYQQHRKDTPHPPKILANGQLSTDKKQLITYQSLRAEIINMFGDIRVAKPSYIDFLNYLSADETMTADKFIKRDYVQRNEHQRQAEGTKILMEVEEMLNPDLALYPNPDRTCAFFCPFNGSCVSMDDGSDWEYELSILMQPRDKGYDSWRKYLPSNEEPVQKW